MKYSLLLFTNNCYILKQYSKRPSNWIILSRNSIIIQSQYILKVCYPKKVKKKCISSNCFTLVSFNFYFVVFFLLKPVILAKAQRSNAKQFVKIICKNHATCFCGLFIFALLLFFYFQIHAVCVKKLQVIQTVVVKIIEAKTRFLFP